MGYFDPSFNRRKKEWKKIKRKEFKKAVSALHEPGDLRISILKEANQRAASLRKRPTEAETKFMEALRGHGVPFVFNWVCALTRSKYRIVDFFIPSLRWLIEIDGGYHKNPRVMQYDGWKDENSKWRTLRYTNEEVLSKSHFIAKEIKRISSKSRVFPRHHCNKVVN